MAFEDISVCSKIYHALRLVKKLRKESYEVVYVKEQWIR